MAGLTQFPSPCGVWVVSAMGFDVMLSVGFPSPCGVWVVSGDVEIMKEINVVSVPLRGVGCFRHILEKFQQYTVSVPLRGVGCFL